MSEDTSSLMDNFGVLERILTIIAMIIPISFSQLGFQYYASMINVIIFGIGIFVLNIPQRVFNRESKVIRILDFFWFTAIYGLMTIFNLIFTDPEGFGTFLSSILTLVREYPAGTASFAEYLIAFIIVGGTIWIIVIGIVSVFILFFWKYNEMLETSGQSPGSAIMVYFALMSFTIFLGLGGTTLVDYVVIILLLRGILIHRLSISKLASDIDVEKRMWKHLLKTVDNPKLASYTIHVFVWGVVASLFLAFLDLSNPYFILFTPITIGLFGLSILFIIDETPLHVSAILYTTFVFILLGVAALSSATNIVLDILQALSDASYSFNNVWSGYAIRIDQYAFYQALANQIGISLDSLIFSAFAHAVLTTFLGSYIFYGACVVVESVEGDTYETTNAIKGWLVVIVAIILEPIFWFGCMTLTGNLHPTFLGFGMGSIFLNLSVAIGIIPMLVLPFFLEVDFLIDKGHHQSHIGVNRYAFVVIIIILTLIWFNASFVTMDGVLILLIGGVFLSGILLWLPLYMKIINSKDMQKYY